MQAICNIEVINYLEKKVSCAVRLFYWMDYGGPPDRLPMFQLVLRKQFDKLEKELIHCLNTVAFVYRVILLLDI
jgi:hypothetical protein